MTLNIEIEDQHSWPAAFLKDATQHKDVLLSFQRERCRIDRLGQEDISVRIKPPENRYKHAYSALALRLESLLTPHKLVAYHCTRLTPTEVVGIKAGGMTLLSARLVMQRLNQCLADGHISSKHHQYLHENENVRANLTNKCGHRTGRIWFCPNRSTLKDFSGVYRLFRSWGGEVMYNGQESDPTISSVLTGIGQPCIVKCALRVSRAKHFHSSLAERFLSQFVSEEFDCPDPSPRFDLYTEEDVPQQGILDIIEFSDPKFATLTEFRNWDAGYRVNGDAC